MQSAENSKEKTSGFGSIWNSNSWFYEEKNFTKFAKDYPLVAERLEALEDKVNKIKK